MSAEGGSRLVILRPQPVADATMEAARELGLDAACYPLFTIEPLKWTPPDPADFDALMLTSANAARHASAELMLYAKLPLFAVGAATADAARTAGLVPYHVGRNDAQALIEAVRQAGHRYILHLCGEDVAPNENSGAAMTRIPVYRAKQTGDAAGLSELLLPGAVALVHSPRAGKRLAALTHPEQRAVLSAVAISARALASAGSGWANAIAAPSPTDTAMLAIARELCHKPDDAAPSAVDKG